MCQVDSMSVISFNLKNIHRFLSRAQGQTKRFLISQKEQILGPL